ncbi:uncharacterized protein [Lepeophtheirus salmonis]|uniref:uncharacterized protein isoform X1 n=1 Tax=Lepeophtheirus salmonis TaxID=72036 RepID=UPI001AE8E649|nr:uncharacterized protein LOC121129306 isoform X1 [Lepeophtheirus salmonis]
MFRGSYLDFAPEWDTIRRPFLPWGKFVKQISLEECSKLREYRTWEMLVGKYKKSIKNHIIRNIMLEMDKNYALKSVDALVDLLDENPLGPIGSLTKSLLCLKGSKTLMKCNGSLLSTNTVSRDTNGIFKRNVLPQDEEIFRASEDISGIDVFSEHSFLATRKKCYIYNMEKRVTVCSPFNVSKIHDFVSLKDGLKSAMSIQGGEVVIYDGTKEISSTQVMPEGTNTKWSCCRLYGDVVMCNDRKTLHFLVPSQPRVIHVDEQALPRDFICDVIISPDEKDFSLVTQKALLMYDIRNLKSCIWSRNHGMEHLPASGGDVIEVNGTNYYTSYNRYGEILVWATESQRLKGLPRRLSPIEDVLNLTIFDTDDQYNRFACPWTGIRLMSPGRKNKILYIVSMTALGDLYCMEVKRSKSDEESYDWLLESSEGYKAEEMELLNNYEVECLKSVHIKKSTAFHICVKPDQYIGSDPMSILPQVPEIPIKRPRASRVRPAFKNLKEFKPLQLENCLDEEGKRVTKILNREQLYMDLPSDVESCASFMSESFRSKAFSSGSSASLDKMKKLDRSIPSDTDYMLGQFFNDLDSIIAPSSQTDEGTSTVLPELFNEQEYLPLTVGSQFDLSEPTLISTQQLTSSQKTKRKRSKVMGF